MFSNTATAHDDSHADNNAEACEHCHAAAGTALVIIGREDTLLCRDCVDTIYGCECDELHTDCTCITVVTFADELS